MSISYLLIKRLNLVEITTLRTEVDWNFWVPHTYIKKLMTNVNAFSIVLNLYHSSLHFTLTTTDAWGIALVSVRPSVHLSCRASTQSDSPEAALTRPAYVSALLCEDRSLVWTALVLQRARGWMRYDISAVLYIRCSDVTVSMATIRSPFCGYKMAICVELRGRRFMVLFK